MLTKGKNDIPISSREYIGESCITNYTVEIGEDARESFLSFFYNVTSLLLHLIHMTQICTSLQSVTDVTAIVSAIPVM